MRLLYRGLTALVFFLVVLTAGSPPFVVFCLCILAAATGTIRVALKEMS